MQYLFELPWLIFFLPPPPYWLNCSQFRILFFFWFPIVRIILSRIIVRKIIFSKIIVNIISIISITIIICIFFSFICAIWTIFCTFFVIVSRGCSCTIIYWIGTTTILDRSIFIISCFIAILNICIIIICYKYNSLWLFYDSIFSFSLISRFVLFSVFRLLFFGRSLLPYTEIGASL